MTPNIGESPGTTLCTSCGLCCSGHLFAWVKLRSAEVESAQALGLRVLGSDPKQRGFNQPCPLWNGACTIYTSPQYPRSCKTYKCKLLKKLLEESINLPEAQTVVREAKQMIHYLESHLPLSPNCNFRERLVMHLESGTASREFEKASKALLQFFAEQFGVNDILPNPDELS